MTWQDTYRILRPSTRQVVLRLYAAIAIRVSVLAPNGLADEAELNPLIRDCRLGVAARPEADLIAKTLDMAYEQHDEQGPQNVLFHRNQSSQYGSRHFYLKW